MTFDQLDPVAVGDLTFDVRTLGPDDGEPVVLLHGFPETSLSWSAVAPMLADAGFRVIAPDQRGYSATARPATVADYTMDHLVDDVLGLADALRPRHLPPRRPRLGCCGQLGGRRPPPAAGSAR